MVKSSGGGPRPSYATIYGTVVPDLFSWFGFDIFSNRRKDIKIVKQIINTKMKINLKLIKIKIINQIPLTHNKKYDYLKLEKNY